MHFFREILFLVNFFFSENAFEEKLGETCCLNNASKKCVFKTARWIMGNKTDWPSLSTRPVTSPLSALGYTWKGTGRERSQAHERRAGSFVRLLYSREVSSSSSHATTARASLHLLLLRSVAVVDRSCIVCSCCCCKLRTSLVAFLVSFHLSSAFVFRL